MKLHQIATLGFAIGMAAVLSSCGTDGAPIGTSAQAVSPYPYPATPATANEFHLGGDDVSVVYAPTAEAGRPVLTYRDAIGSWVFDRNDIEVFATSAGTFISVLRPIDNGSATLSLLIPRVQLRGQGAELIQTMVITTLHRDHAEGTGAALVAPTYGQLDQYQLTPIWGTALHAEDVHIPTK
jgi:hypothetical protein